jgi:hypothetical protein
MAHVLTDIQKDIVTVIQNDNSEKSSTQKYITHNYPKKEKID